MNNMPKAGDDAKADNRLLVLQCFPPKLLSMDFDGRNAKTLVPRLGGTPDAVAVDRKRGHIFWTNMGRNYGKPDGFIERSNLDGSGRVIIVAPGRTFTPKQIEYEPQTDRLYWGDREGMRIMSARTDGSDVTVHVQTGSSKADRSDKRNHCVGVAVEPVSGHIYWTQKGPPNGGQGRILRAPLDAGAGQDPARRTDIETLMDGLPEPIDLFIDAARTTLYWTDRGNNQGGNSINAATITASGLTGHRILVDGLHEAIGVCASQDESSLFFTELYPGHVRRLDLNGGGKPRVLRWGWPMNGICIAPRA